MNQALASNSFSVGESAPAAAVELPELVLKARKGWISVDWAELFHNRELLYFFVWRDVKLRYKQTLLGVTWAVMQPAFNTLIFTLIFGIFAKLPSEGLHYALFSFCALLPWTLFANGISLAGQSMISQQHLLTKIYLPRLLVPTAAVGVCLVDLAASSALFAIVMAVYRQPISWEIIFVVPLLALTLLFTLGVGFLLAAMTVSYHDFRHVTPFMIQAWMYLSPVIYPSFIIPHRIQWIWCLNPMAGLIEGMRSAVLGRPWNVGMLVASTVLTLFTFTLGLFFFRKMERRFADVA
jgi:lipopolysaccharide transport system permease protein